MPPVSCRAGWTVIHAAVCALAFVMPACQRPPEFVFVPETPPEVTVRISAEASEVQAGRPLVLHATRTTRGRWRQVRLADLPPDACWMAERPPAEEGEVAANLQWKATPPAATFNVDLREDHTRAVTFAGEGTVVLEASSAVWCGPPVTAAPLTITVLPERR